MDHSQELAEIAVTARLVSLGYSPKNFWDEGTVANLVFIGYALHEILEGDISDTDLLEAAGFSD